MPSIAAAGMLIYLFWILGAFMKRLTTIVMGNRTYKDQFKLTSSNPAILTLIGLTSWADDLSVYVFNKALRFSVETKREITYKFVNSERKFKGGMAAYEINAAAKDYAAQLKEKVAKEADEISKYNLGIAKVIAAYKTHLTKEQKIATPDMDKTIENILTHNVSNEIRTIVKTLGEGGTGDIAAVVKALYTNNIGYTS